MISQEQERRILDALSLQIAQQANKSFAELLDKLRAGDVSAKQALAEASREFGSRYYVEFASALSTILGKEVTDAEIRALEVSGNPLSKHLNSLFRETNAVAHTLIKENRTAFYQAKELAIRLFADTTPVPTPIAIQSLPKPLRALMLDAQVGPQLKSVYARMQVNRIRTPALKSAYLQIIEGVEQGAGWDRLKKKLDIAWKERSRYLASRIAETESHRAYMEEVGREMMADDSLKYVKYVLSPGHREIDQCDCYANVDRYGLGPGVFPKGLAPTPPLHPHCRCTILGQWHLSDAKYRERPGAQRAYLRRLDPREAARVAGSQAKRDEILSGGDFHEVIGRGVPDEYRTRRLGDLPD